ncbi:hypothetical protein SNEBB_011450 [Seison nebaliae]|nr:hypothetical protein SNEBB_011450 [Seison nebaliae]
METENVDGYMIHMKENHKSLRYFIIGLILCTPNAIFIVPNDDLHRKQMLQLSDRIKNCQRKSLNSEGDMECDETFEYNLTNIKTCYKLALNRRLKTEKMINNVNEYDSILTNQLTGVTHTEFLTAIVGKMLRTIFANKKNRSYSSLSTNVELQIERKLSRVNKDKNEDNSSTTSTSTSSNDDSEIYANRETESSLIDLRHQKLLLKFRLTKSFRPLNHHKRPMSKKNKENMEFFHNLIMNEGNENPTYSTIDLVSMRVIQNKNFFNFFP